MPEPINVVIDISHHQEKVNFEKIKAAGIVGIIHKATQGFKFVDKKYAARQAQALDAGLLWGGYHFGVGGDGSDQADHFLNIVKPGKDRLIVLDYEPDPQGPSMDLAQAREFVSHVQATVGRFPVFYSGHTIKEQLGNKPPDPVLSNCPLWIAQYKGTTPFNIPPTFKTWTFWQYTDGVAGPEPHSVTGVGLCDRDKFNGSLEGLKKLWSGKA